MRHPRASFVKSSGGEYTYLPPELRSGPRPPYPEAFSLGGFPFCGATIADWTAYALIQLNRRPSSGCCPRPPDHLGVPEEVTTAAIHGQVHDPSVSRLASGENQSSATQHAAIVSARVMRSPGGSLRSRDFRRVARRLRRPCRWSNRSWGAVGDSRGLKAVEGGLGICRRATGWLNRPTVLMSLFAPLQSPI